MKVLRKIRICFKINFTLNIFQVRKKLFNGGRKINKLNSSKKSFTSFFNEYIYFSKFTF